MKHHTEPTDKGLSELVSGRPMGMTDSRRAQSTGKQALPVKDALEPVPVPSDTYPLDLLPVDSEEDTQ